MVAGCGGPEAVVTGGKSELHRAGRLVTPGRGDPLESATESRPPYRASAFGSELFGKGERVR